MTDRAQTTADSVAQIQEIEDTLRDEFKATSVDVHSHGDGRTVSLRFRGFSDLSDAVDKIVKVAGEFNNLEECDDVDFNVNSEGMYDPEADEMDERPAGTVRAQFNT